MNSLDSSFTMVYDICMIYDRRSHEVSRPLNNMLPDHSTMHNIYDIFTQAHTNILKSDLYRKNVSMNTFFLLYVN